MEEKITKEHIAQVVKETVEELNLDIESQFLEAMDNCDNESKNNPVIRELLAAAIVQMNASTIMVEVLYKLLNE